MTDRSLVLCCSTNTGNLATSCDLKIALAFSPIPARPHTPAHVSLALLVFAFEFACVLVSLVVQVGLAGVRAGVLCASGTPIFASPGVGSVVFVCASLALCFL